MSIGENIKKIRRDNNLTQKQFAELINKKERTVQRYENGDILPPINVLGEIAKVLGVTTCDLVNMNLGTIIDLEIRPINLSQILTKDLIEELNKRKDFELKLIYKESEDKE